MGRVVYSPILTLLCMLDWFSGETGVSSNVFSEVPRLSQAGNSPPITKMSPGAFLCSVLWCAVVAKLQY